MAPWLLLGAILGEMMIWLALQLCQARWKSSVEGVGNLKSARFEASGLDFTLDFIVFHRVFSDFHCFLIDFQRFPLDFH